jgi:hypothetical protein
MLERSSRGRTRWSFVHGSLLASAGAVLSQRVRGEGVLSPANAPAAALGRGRIGKLDEDR